MKSTKCFSPLLTAEVNHQAHQWQAHARQDKTQNGRDKKLPTFKAQFGWKNQIARAKEKGKEHKADD